MTLVKIARKNQVTIPHSVRKQLPFRPGDTLIGRIDQGRVILTATNQQDRPNEYEIRLRDRYQLTLSEKLCRDLWLSDSHILEMQACDGELVIVPKTIIKSISEDVIVNNAREARMAQLKNNSLTGTRLDELARRSKRKGKKRK